MLPTSSVSIGRRRYSGGEAGLARCITSVNGVRSAVSSRSTPAVVGDVELDEVEPVMAEQVRDVAGVACAAVVDADDAITAVDQAVADVRADEAGPAGDDDMPQRGQRPTPS